MHELHIPYMYVYVYREELANMSGNTNTGETVNHIKADARHSWLT